MHDSTFAYFKPTDQQLSAMEELRTAAKEYAAILESALPDGPDKTYTLRKFREVAMWVNVTLTRQADGSPRLD
jgi:hypothetical protein